MKNFIKAVTIFGVIIFVSPAHAMESEQTSSYSFSISTLKVWNPFSAMASAPIIRLNNRYFIFENDPLHTKEGLTVQLAIVKALEQSRTNNKKTLQKIYQAVSEGMSETSMLNIELFNEYSIKISPSQTPISASQLIEDWSQQRQLTDEDKKNDLIVTIVKGKLNREATLSCKLTACTRDDLGINVPQDIIGLMLSHLPECNVDEESQRSPKLIEQAKQGFDKEQKIATAH